MVHKLLFMLTVTKIATSSSIAKKWVVINKNGKMLPSHLLAFHEMVLYGMVSTVRRVI